MSSGFRHELAEQAGKRTPPADGCQRAGMEDQGQQALARFWLPALQSGAAPPKARLTRRPWSPGASPGLAWPIAVASWLSVRATLPTPCRPSADSPSTFFWPGANPDQCVPDITHTGGALASGGAETVRVSGTAFELSARWCRSCPNETRRKLRQDHGSPSGEAVFDVIAHHDTGDGIELSHQKVAGEANVSKSSLDDVLGTKIGAHRNTTKA